MLTTLRAVREAERAQLWTILSTYLRELNQYGEVDLDYPFFNRYWIDEVRRPYFIENEKNIVGFVLLNDWSPSRKGTDFGLAEFYILPAFRGLGVGKRAFTSLLGSHPGAWELSVMIGNDGAKKFWERIIYSSHVIDVERLILDDQLIYRFVAIN